MPQVELKMPASVEVERLLLASAMLYRSEMDTMRSLISEGEFSLHKHQLIWRSMVKLYDAGLSVEQVTVYTALKDAGQSDACDGLGYLISLDDGIPQVPNVETYIQILKDKSIRRRAILSAQHLMNRAMAEDEPIDDLLSSFGETEAKLSEGKMEDTKPVSTADLIEKVGVDTLLSPRRHGEVRLPWAKLDRSLSGFSGGQVIVLLGETSRGKTSFALQAAIHAAQHIGSVLIWTMEMSPRSIFRRLVTQLSGVPISGGTAQLTFDERDRHRIAIAHLTNYPIYLDSRSRSVTSFNSSIRYVRSKTKLGLAVVDYLQLIRSNNRQNRTQQVSENSRNLKLAAMDFDLPILVLSQVDRASVKGDGKIGLHSAKEAGDVENDADVLLWIESKELSREQETPVAIAIGKQREGPAGFKIPMVFRPVSQTFLETANE